MDAVRVECRQSAAAAGKTEFAVQGGFSVIVQVTAYAIGKGAFQKGCFYVIVCLGKINIWQVPDIRVIVFIDVTGCYQVPVWVIGFQVSGHFFMPGCNIVFALFKLIGPAHFIKQFPGHDIAGIAPACQNVSVTVFGVVFSRCIAEKIPGIGTGATIGCIVRAIAPVGIYVG